MTSPLAGPAGSALTSAKQNATPVAGRSQELARVTYLQSLGRGVAVLDLISQSVPGISAREMPPSGSKTQLRDRLTGVLT